MNESFPLINKTTLGLYICNMVKKSWVLVFLLIWACNNPSIDPIPDGNNGFAQSAIPFIAFDADEEIPDEPKVPGRLFIYQNGEELHSSLMGIELRGSTSRRLFPKKSYGIELKEINGDDRSLDLFGFGSEEDWVLYGPYSDKTFMRNALIYLLSNQIGVYAPETQFVEVEYGGEYLGLYVFMERIKRGGDRLVLERLNQAVTDPEAITGGYILKIDKTSGDTDNSDWAGDALYSEHLGFRSPYGAHSNLLDYGAYGDKRGEETYFLYEYPDRDLITDQQKNYIQNYIIAFEEALLNDDFSQETRTYTNYIDLASFADFFILNEISANPDGYRLSTYMHKDRNEKLKMGPIWDFNLAFGNDGRSSPSGWIYQYNQNFPGDLWLIHFWWERLLDDPQFRAVIKERWELHKSGRLSIANINNIIDQWSVYLNENGAVGRNYDKWPVLGVALPFNSYVGQTYEDELNYLKGWITSRHFWMDQQISAW